MRLLQTFGLSDYDPTLPLSKRTAARGIIRRDGKLLLVRSDKYGEYKFPGGGIEEGEGPIEALIREVREEAGLIVLPHSIREYGKTIERRLDRFEPKIFEQHSYYYLCDASEECTALQLDEYEQEYGYRPMFTAVDQAIAANQAYAGTTERIPWTERELFMLRHLRQHLPGVEKD